MSQLRDIRKFLYLKQAEVGISIQLSQEKKGQETYSTQIHKEEVQWEMNRFKFFSGCVVYFLFFVEKFFKQVLELRKKEREYKAIQHLFAGDM